MNTVAQENLAGVRTVKSFAREPYEIKKFRKHNQKYCDLNMDQARVLMKYDPAISFLTKLMRVLVLLAGGYGVIHGRITLGVLTAFMEYTSKITWPIENVGWLGNCFASAIASNKKLNKILAEEPQIAEPENPVELSKLPCDLEFHHVDFSLHDTPILQDIDFTLKQGHTLGIMGMTGSGKQPSSICSSVFTMSPTVPSVSTATISAPCRCAPCAILLPSSCRMSSCSQIPF